MKISVCVGSSCHLKGSYDVIEELKRIIKKYDVEDVVRVRTGETGYDALQDSDEKD